MTMRHTRTSSASSDILSVETVSSLQRWVFGNIFRSQRQLLRFGFFLAAFILVTYLLNPFGSPDETTPDAKHPIVKPPAVVRSVAEKDVERKAVSEYHATFFEEMGKRFAGKDYNVKFDSQHFENELPEVSKSDIVSLQEQTKLNKIAEMVGAAALGVSKCHEVPGMSIVLVKGKNSAKIPIGMADMAARQPVTTDTKFLLNSISKTFLGQLLAVLISEKSSNVTLDTRVADILGPDLQLATEELTREVTLRDLLSHRSGLSSGNLAVRATYPDGWTRADVVRKLKYLPASLPFRKGFLYSNLGAVLLTHILEKIGGAPWEKLIVDKLLAPLGMLSSKPMTKASQLEANNVSRLYVPIEGSVTLADTRIFNQGPLSPVALLTTTASDVTKWLQFNLAHGQLPAGRQLISQDLWSTMWTKHTDLSDMFLAGIDKSGNQWPVKDRSEGYGLFWFINKYRGLKNFWHGGGLYTHHTLAWHFPEKDVALYAVINGFSGDSKPFAIVESLAYYATDLLLGYQPWLDEKSICSYPKPWVSDRSKNQTETDKDGKVDEKKGAQASGSKGGDLQGGVKERVDEESVEFANADLSQDAKKQEGLHGVDLGHRKGNIFASLRNVDEKDADSQSSFLKLVRKAGLEHQQSAEKNDQAKQRNQGSSFFSALTSNQSNSAQDPAKLAAPKFSLKLYEGLYHCPLFGEFSVFLSPLSGNLGCHMNVLTGILHPLEGHTFGVELTKSLRHLSKPSQNLPARNNFHVSFVATDSGEITAVDVHSSWFVEVPIKFQKMR